MKGMISKEIRLLSFMYYLRRLGIPPSPKISMGSRGEVLGKTMRLSSSSKPETIEEGSGSKMKNFSYEAI
jgi:hypothetical protein